MFCFHGAVWISRYLGRETRKEVQNQSTYLIWHFQKKNTVFLFTIGSIKMGTSWVFWKFQLLFRQKDHYQSTSTQLFSPHWIVSAQQIMAAETGSRFHPFCWEQNSSLSAKITLTILLYICDTFIIFLLLRTLCVTQEFPCHLGMLWHDHRGRIHQSVNQSMNPSIYLCMPMHWLIS